MEISHIYISLSSTHYLLIHAHPGKYLLTWVMQGIPRRNPRKQTLPVNAVFHLCKAFGKLSSRAPVRVWTWTIYIKRKTSECIKNLKYASFWILELIFFLAKYCDYFCFQRKSCKVNMQLCRRFCYKFCTVRTLLCQELRRVLLMTTCNVLCTR